MLAIAVAAILVIGRLAFGRATRGHRPRPSRVEADERRRERERDAQARRAAGEERARIARELHDIVGHSVSLMVVQAIAAQRAPGGSREAGPDPRGRALASIEATGRQAMGEMRRLRAILDESGEGAIAPQPGLAELPELIDEVGRAGLDVALSESGGRPALSPGLELALYRIAQDALTNALEHAGPSRVEIDLDYREAEVGLRILDRGGTPTGADEPRSDGTGIAGMRERATIYGGELNATPSSRGFAVEARLPIGQRYS